MFCSKCGTQLPDDAEFCSNCGQKVGDTAPEPASAPQPTPASAPQPASTGNAAAKAEAAADKIGAAAEVAADKMGAAAGAAAEKAGAAAEVAMAKTSNFFKTKFLPGVKKYLKWIILGAVIVVAIIAFFVTGSVMSNPANVVTGFVSNMANGNYAAAFDQLDVEESEFINGDLFAQYISEEGTDYSEYRNYRVMTYNDYVRQQASQYGLSGMLDSYLQEEPSDGSTLTYVAVAPDNSDGLTFTLNKQDSNFLLFWPTYKIDAEDMLADATIYTLSGSTVTIDGINVPAAQADEDTPEGLTPYTVPSLLSGDHDLVITNPLTEDYETEISVYAGYTRSVTYLTLKEEVMDERFAASQDLIQTIVNGAIANTEFEDLGIAVTADADAVAEMKEEYNDLMDDFHNDDGTGLKSVTFTGEYTNRSYNDELDSDGSYTSRLYFYYDCVETTMDRSTNQLVDEPSSYTHTGNFAATYTYENGQLMLYSLDTLFVSY